MLPTRPHSILVVDDEPGILNAIRRQLSDAFTGRHRYHVEMISNPELALERAGEAEFDTIICDYRMPEMDGVTFLKLFAEKQPDCSRIVLSGQADMTVLTAFINETHLFRFLPKPWDGDFLRKSVVEAIALKLRNRRRRRRQAAPAADFWQLARREHCLVDQKGVRVTLTDTETTLIEILVRADGRPATRKQLIEALGHNFMTYDERRIEVKFSRLRKKIREITGGEEPIRSEWGTGYLFIPPCRIN